MMKYTVSFTAWYLNPERIYQLVNAPTLAHHLDKLDGVSGRAFLHSDAGIARSVVKQKLEEWLHCNPVPSLGELVVKGELREGKLFTIYQDFYGRGLSKYNDLAGALPRNAIAELHNTLKYDEQRRLRIVYSPANLISSSAWHRLSGRNRLFCFCYIEQVTDNEILARPYLIGDIHTGLKFETPSAWNGRNYGEVHVTEIDQFKAIRDVYESEKQPPALDALKAIPEIEVKKAIAEIINEDAVPVDWGGEKSDLFSCNLSMNGRYMPSAFLLKGPAKFSEMKMTHLGKNGDQIDRLFSEPADLLVLQHCHKISTAVRSTMRAFASRVHDLRYFSIIDGYDTLRLLKAYGKCGV